jgi:hypothetical protein
MSSRAVWHLEGSVFFRLKNKNKKLREKYFVIGK